MGKTKQIQTFLRKCPKFGHFFFCAQNSDILIFMSMENGKKKRYDPVNNKKRGMRMKSLKAVKNIYLGLIVCSVIMGAALFIWPQMGLDVLCKVYGVILIVYGIAKISGYFTKDLFQLAFQFDFAMGVITAVLGIVLLARTGRVIEFLSILIGIFMLVDATFKIQTAFDAKRFGIARWWLILATAIAVALVGILLLFAPLETTGIFVRLLGLSICFDGIMNLIVVCNTVRTIRHTEKEEETRQMDDI